MKVEIELVFLRANLVRGEVASWLVRSSPGRGVWVQALAGDIVFLAVPVSTQAPVVRKPISANPRLNRPNPRNKFIPRLNSVPRSSISTIQGLN